MTPAEYDATFAIDHLRLMARNFDGCNESFNQQFSLEGLIAIHKAWMLSGWDINPDRWAPLQVRQALKGIPPRWDDDMKPVFT